MKNPSDQSITSEKSLKIGNVHKYAGEEDRPGKTIFVIIADGMENAGCMYCYNRVEEMAERQKEKYGREFLFLDGQY